MIYVALVCCWLAVLLRTWPGWWRALNAGGAHTGRAIAWFCSGGLGRAFARPWFEGWASDDRVAAAWDARRADWRPLSGGLWQAIRPVPSLAGQLDVYEPGWCGEPWQHKDGSPCKHKLLCAGGASPVRCPQQCPYCPGEGFCARVAAAQTRARLGYRE